MFTGTSDDKKIIMCGCTKRLSLVTSTAGVQFEYTGNAPLSIRGNYTQNVYRFQPGETLTVDRRDAIGFENVSLLKKVSPS
jgi:hypothetical protein